MFHVIQDARRRLRILATLSSILILLFCPRAISAGYPAKESVSHMKVPPGLRVKLVASEPEIRQPLSVDFDDRGRMWVIQYLQYPTPAGIKAVEVDQYLRTKYDKLPEPPPKGPAGADKITICEDTDGDGVYDKFTDFITGLNMATGLAIGNDGIYVAQPPYLLFIPDRNHDDKPDGDPEVLFTGFGMEDAHAFANSLQWGPDGWLYGAQGSTVTAKLRGLEFQQGIWRYNIESHDFELFAEGGGNTWGLDFDEHGNAIVGTNYGDRIALHQVQGGYYVKGFTKHGPLHNPYSFGYFEHIPYTGFKGGHVTSGGVFYSADAFPESFRGTYMAANVLANAVYWHTFEKEGSSFKARFGGELLTTDDTWFRPVDCLVGPDGALFVVDWCDKRATHLDPKDTWDRSNGRIYKVEPEKPKPMAPFDLRKQSSSELVSLLDHPNDWWRRAARRNLAGRHDEKVLPDLEKLIFREGTSRLQLEALWAYYEVGGLESPFILRLLQHPNEDIRAWAIRLVGDGRIAPPAVMTRLAGLARDESSPVVRNQLACSARRFRLADALELLPGLMAHDADATDPQLPLLIWWAVETHAIAGKTALLELFKKPESWTHPLVRDIVASRLARRYAADAKKADLDACLALLLNAPGDKNQEMIAAGIDSGLAGRKIQKIPDGFDTWFKKRWEMGQPGPGVIRLGLRLGREEAVGPAVQFCSRPGGSEADRLAMIDALGQMANPGTLKSMITLFSTANDPKIKAAALAALSRFGDPAVASIIMSGFPRFSKELRTRALGVLASRPEWAMQLIEAVDRKTVPPGEITQGVLLQLGALKNPQIKEAVTKRWGKVQTENTASRQNAFNELKLLLNPSGAAGRDRKGDLAAGRASFQKNCAVCHKMFGEGGAIGPDLTGVARVDLDFLLLNIVNPSAFIRPEFAAFEITSKQDQVLTGLVVESNAAAVTLVDRNNIRTVLPRSEIREMKESQVSLMPEGLLEALPPQEVIDLFTYLQSDGK